MFYLENYGPYSTLIDNKSIIIENTSINAQTWETHFVSILNIMRDGIETEYMRNVFVTIRFDVIDVDLSIADYWFNLMMWQLIVKSGKEIRPKHIIFEHGITRRLIKNFIDTEFIKDNRTTMNNMLINNLIDDCMYNFRYIDEFAFYLANTINLEDFIDLMKQYPEFNDIIHADLTGVPLEEIKEVGMKLANESIRYIKNSDHCLSNFFIANEGVNPKQYKEFAINIGTKPDGRGGVYPVNVNTNFIIGGVNDPMSYIIESSTGRTAQVIVEGNVGISGAFARLLGLNNIDTNIHKDPHYICDSKNFQELFITDESMLNRIDNRYYRLTPNGMEYKIDASIDKHLKGRTIYLRSPMTCASAARGNGVCYRCYGDLAYTNNDINIGKMASELMSSILTQMMLSAKHLLESSIKKVNWNEQFKDLFDIEYNIIKLQEEVDFTGFRLIIDPDNIILENEDEDSPETEFSEYVNDFEILYPNGEVVSFFTSNADNLYITSELNGFIRQFGEKLDSKIVLDVNKMKEEEINLFAVQIHNNDLSRTLDKVKDILDKTSVTCKMNRHQLLQSLNDTLKEGGMNVDSVHGEIILANQLRSKDDILCNPEWEYENEDYSVLTLKQALANNPSISISLAYGRISRTLYTPLTYRKNKPSFMDLFFMEQPQIYLSDKSEIKIADKDKYNNGLKTVMTKIDKKFEDDDEI